MTRRGLLGLPVLLAGGAKDGDAGPCRMRLAAELPATLDDNRVVVAGKVSGAEVPLLIDTGAERTVLSRATAASLGLPCSQRSASRLTGIAGSVSNADVFATAALGGERVEQRFALAALPGIGGLIGGDVLGRYDLELNLPGRQVRLRRTPGCGIADLPWSGPRAAVPVTGGDRLRLRVMVDGVALDALLDSGAPYSILHQDAMGRLGVAPSALDVAPVTTAQGVDGGAIRLRLLRFGTMQVGDEQISAPRLWVGGFRRDAAEMLLGADYLLPRRVWIAYRSGRVWVRRADRGG